MRYVYLKEQMEPTVVFKGLSKHTGGVKVRLTMSQMMFVKHARADWTQAQRMLRQLLKNRETKPNGIRL